MILDHNLVLVKLVRTYEEQMNENVKKAYGW